jgi:hypothetical protein
MLETLLILILVFSQKMRGDWSLVPDVPDMFLSDIVPFFFLGPTAGIGLLPPCMLTGCMSCHINTKRKIYDSSCICNVRHIFC